MKNPLHLLAGTGLVAALALAGCSGGNDDDEPVPPNAISEVPDSAGAGSTSFINFIQNLSASDESSEPLLIKDSFSVPADESGEPIPLT